jgi:hypothetical protein
MKTKHFSFVIPVCISLGMMLFVSCSDQETEFSTGKDTLQNRTQNSQDVKDRLVFQIDEKTAVSVARRIDQQGKFFRPDISTPERAVETTYPIADATGMNVMYIVNYADDGFSVLSADARYTALCAYVERGKYEKVAVPSGLVDWMETTSQFISSIGQNQNGNGPISATPWALAMEETGLEPMLFNNNCCPECPNYPECLTNTTLGCGEPDIWCQQNGDGNSSGTGTSEIDDPCGPFSTTTKGPLLTTTWGQACTYNENCPLLGCNACYSNTRAYTGCVATAISQVLRYWEHPNQFLYYYYSMPDHQGNREVQRMMRDAGNSVSMNYGCSGSGATGSSIPRSFKNTFAFGNAERKTYQPADYVTILQNIDQEHPLVLDGCQNVSKVFGFFTTFDKCHAWVCDGYQINRNKCVNDIKLHMNWGWDGYYNGWFHFQTWTGPGTGFPYNQNLTYNIIP